MVLCNSLLYFCIAIFSVLTSAKTENVTITVQLNGTFTQDNREIYGSFYTITNNSTVQVLFEIFNKNIEFYIFQVHSQHYNLTLYNETMAVGHMICGSNLGLYINSIQAAFTQIRIWNRNNLNVKIYISVHAYMKNDPIPGGCNMEDSIFISPNMHLRYNDHMVSVSAPSAQAPRKQCEITFVEQKFYIMYLPARAFDEDTYFEGIRTFMTIDNIRKKGKEIHHPVYGRIADILRMVGAYPGTGAVFVSVAYLNATAYSVYVPTYTYGCSVTDITDDNGRRCGLLMDATPILFSIVLLCIGLFKCFLGHRFFKTGMFLIGMFTGVTITYIIMSLTTNLRVPVLLWASVTIGLLYGVTWLLFWCFFGIPVLSVLLSTLNLGFLVAAISYQLMPYPSKGIIETQETFWPLFISLMLLTSLALTMNIRSNLLCCAVLGSFAFVYSFDLFVGSNIKYIIINIVRRATVEGFAYVDVAPPFQWRDGILTTMWIGLAASGLTFQYFHNKRHPPFPSPPRMTHAYAVRPNFMRFGGSRPTSVSPLLRNEEVSRSSLSNNRPSRSNYGSIDAVPTDTNGLSHNVDPKSSHDYVSNVVPTERDAYTAHNPNGYTQRDGDATNTQLRSDEDHSTTPFLNGSQKRSQPDRLNGTELKRSSGSTPFNRSWGSAALGRIKTLFESSREENESLLDADNDPTTDGNRTNYRST